MSLLDTLYRLQSAIDGRQWDTIAATFLPDATGYGATGIDDILSTMKAHLGGCGPTQHLIGNPVVEVDGDRATTRCYARVHHVGSGDAEGRFFECMGDYEDHWSRTPEGWRLAHRRFEMRIRLGDFDVLRPANC